MNINNCNICEKATDTVLKLPFIDLHGSNQHQYIQEIGFCKNCGFIYTKNPFSEQQLNNRYKNESKYEYDSEEYFLNEAEEYKKRCIRQQQFIDRNIKGQYSSILEIGSASGYNLSIYKNIKKLGIEPSKINCKLAKKIYDITMFNGTFAEYINQMYNSNSTYDIIFLSHVLEHIIDPYHFMQQCKNICNKYIFIEVPTFDYKLEEEPMGMFCEEHVNYFTLESLQNLMNKIGFKLVDINIIFGVDVNIPAGWPATSSLWIKSDKNDIVPLNPIYNTEILIKTYIKRNKEQLLKINKKISIIPENEKLAIWGVGHHASMLLANTSLLQKNIVRVYDSDASKQDFIFAGKKISFFNENDIINGEVEGILVTTYTAQIAISKILSNYNDICNIYYLYDL